tara:strand:+ start:803 stop:1171 length:369 start_codon:yes stop_codon:yes gene_type:complete
MDRFLTWYSESTIGDGTSTGPVYIMDRDYQPRVVRVHAKRVPDATHLELDIKDDGASIFSNTVRLAKNSNAEDVAEDFKPSATTIKRYSAVSLDLTPNGAHGVTVTLELVAEEDEEITDSNT